MIAAVVAVVVLAASAGYAVIRVRQHQEAGAGLRASGIPGSVSTSLSDLMQLSPVPVRGAPGFTLTDQGGHAVSLAGLRGKVVVLEFMDPHCTDICPIVSQEFIDAYRDLGASAARVVFVAVNVNRYHLRVADVAAFSSEQRLTQVPSWHFLTGSYPSLAAVWQAYEITVDAPGPDADVVHSSQMYFIDPQGQERFVADPMVDHTASGSSYLPAGQLASWGQGIALVARQLVT
ncbi:MAG TPA: SCO family protein [Streptosporangiaceae bacterium]|nr:SCO family protein [Streptosporangiaceae bacterium]